MSGPEDIVTDDAEEIMYGGENTLRATSILLLILTSTCVDLIKYFVSIGDSVDHREITSSKLCDAFT